MAQKRLKNGMYGVTELRLPVNVSVKIQDINFGALTLIENGQLLKLDQKTGVLALPAVTDYVYFVHSVPKNYEGAFGSERYAMTPNGFLPRVIGLGKDSVIATDNVIVDDAVADLVTFQAMSAFLATPANKLYGAVDPTTGVMAITKVKSATAVNNFEVTEVTIMKDGNYGLELIAL